MNILMLGCSFGVPNYYGKPGDPPETHLQFLLEDAGHTVYNLSQNGSSNFNVFEKTNQYLDGEEVDGVLMPHAPDPDNYFVHRKIQKPEDFSVDFIIWFHTSVLRDYRVGQGTITEQIEHLSHSTYEKIFNIRKRLEFPPILTIGGTAPLFEFYNEYGTNVLFIKNWISEILNKEMPANQLFGAIYKLEEMSDTPENIKRYVQEAEIIQQELEQSDLFPDSGHPGKEAHLELFNRIEPILQA